MTGALVFIALAASALLLVPAAGARRWRALPGRLLDGKEPSERPETADGVDDLPLVLELLGAALDAGASVPRSLQLVSAVCTPRLRDGLDAVVAGLAMGASWEHSWRGVRTQHELAALYRALSFAALTGAPSTSLLYAEAQQLRRDAQRAAERRAAALGVKLVLPLGLCSLPAFIALGVVPVVVAMVPRLP
ncbi:type II secretion system F family protein [Pseudarthrobacter sp. P1]|uniref:type II secretion system F family protein n=1 Tax=Pseudarthrobacter sp. P1 TaxID=3418418 RepID=UPI003CF740B4